jgi:hypothetical protein
LNLVGFAAAVVLLAADLVVFWWMMATADHGTRKGPEALRVGEPGALVDGPAPVRQEHEV